jgi:hypothetical protein
MVIGRGNRLSTLNLALPLLNLFAVPIKFSKITIVIESEPWDRLFFVPEGHEGLQNRRCLFLRNDLKGS